MPASFSPAQISAIKSFICFNSAIVSFVSGKPSLEKLGHFLGKESTWAEQTVDCLIKLNRYPRSGVPGRLRSHGGGRDLRGSANGRLNGAERLLGTHGAARRIDSDPCSGLTGCILIEVDMPATELAAASRNPLALFSRYRLRSGGISPLNRDDAPSAALARSRTGQAW